MQISTQLRSASVALALALAPLSAWGSNLNYLFGYTQPTLMAAAASSDPLKNQSVNFSSSVGALSSVSNVWGGSASIVSTAANSAILGGIQTYSTSSSSGLGGAWGSAPSSLSSFGSSTSFGSFGSSFAGSTFNSFGGSSGLGLWTSNTPNASPDFGGTTSVVYPAFGNIGLNAVNTTTKTVALPATIGTPSSSDSPFVVPEPSTWMLLFSGLGSLALLRRRTAN